MVSQLSTPSVALIFAGQGNPVIGMGSDLWDLNAVTKIFGTARAILPKLIFAVYASAGR